MTRTCPYCSAMVEDDQRAGDPCTVCFGSTDNTVRGLAFAWLILAVVIVGVIAAFTWIRP